MAERSKSFKPTIQSLSEQDLNLNISAKMTYRGVNPKAKRPVRKRPPNLPKPAGPATEVPKPILSPKTLSKLNKKSLLISAGPEENLWATDESVFEDTMLSPIKEDTAEFSMDCDSGLASKIRKKDDPFASHKRMALLHNNMWVECLKCWWEILEPCTDDSDEGYLLPS
jgi:hypothetical protein